MSGSLNNIYNNVSYALLINTKAMAKLQEQASTGSRINRVSDDSTSAHKVLSLQSQQKSLDNYEDYKDKHCKVINKVPTSIRAFAKHLSNVYCGASTEFVLRWFNDIWEEITYVDKWKGDLQKHIFTTDSKRFFKQGCQISTEYCSNSDRFVQYLKRIRKA